MNPELKCGVYEHYKGGLYQLLGVGEHTETKELMVIYVSLTGAHLPGPRIRIRPLAMFLEEVDWPSGKRAPRFVYLGIDTPPADDPGS